MQQTFTEFSTNAILKIGNESLLSDYKKSTQTELYTFIRTHNTKAEIIVDSIPYTIEPESLLVLTPIQYIQFVKGENLVVYQFNQEFYCIKDHDQEVSCAGLLFFGNVHVPLIGLSTDEVHKFIKIFCSRCKYALSSYHQNICSIKRAFLTFKEEKAKALKSKKEEEKVQQEMARIRKEMHEERKKKEEHAAR